MAATIRNTASDHVVGLGDGPGVHRWREEPVDHQRGGHSGDERRPQATHHRHRTHEEQAQQHLRGQVEVPLHGEEQHRQQRDPHHAQHPPRRLAAGRESGGPTAAGREEPLPAAAGDLVAGDDVDVDGSGAADDAVDDRPAGEHLPPSRAGGRAQHQLGGVLGEGEAGQALGRVRAHDLVVDATEVGQELAMGLEALARLLESGVGTHVDPDQLRVRAVGHAGGPADQVLATRGPGDGDDDALPRLPLAVDAMGLAVVAQRRIDPVRGPQQGQLPEGGEVARPEVVGERSVDLVRAVDVAVRHPSTEGLGCHVDQLDLLRGPHHLVGHRLELLDARDLLDHVVHALEVLDVHRRDHVDPGGEQLLDVLPSLVVAAPRHVGVGQLVDEGDLGPASEHGVEVHLLEAGPPVLELAPRHDLEVTDLLEGLRPPVGLDQGDHHVGAPVPPAPPFVEHRERLAHARGRTQVDPQLPSRHA